MPSKQSVFKQSSLEIFLKHWYKIMIKYVQIIVKEKERQLKDYTLCARDKGVVKVGRKREGKEIWGRGGN